MQSSKPETIDQYIAGFPKGIQHQLKLIRAEIRKAAPRSEETVKYGIPTYVLNGNLVSFAAFKNHIGLYPVPRGVEAFKKELANYQGAKATARFPHGQPLPLSLIKKIVKFRVQKCLEKVKVKK